MAEDKKLGRITKHISQITLAYSLWLASGALSLWALVWLRSLLLVDIPIAVFRVNPWVFRAVDRFGTIALGLLWLVFMVASESYFRRLYTAQMPVINTLKVFIVEGLLLGAAYGGQLVISLWVG